MCTAEQVHTDFATSGFRALVASELPDIVLISRVLSLAVSFHLLLAQVTLRVSCWQLADGERTFCLFT